MALGGARTIPTGALVCVFPLRENIS